MGNCYDSRKNTVVLAFDQAEYTQLNSQFQYYCELSSETRDIKQLNQRSFEDIFSENSAFGIKLFKFLELYSGSDGFVKKEPLFEFCNINITYIIVELLVKDVQTSVPAFKNLERFELMSLITLQNYRYVKSKEELAQLQLTYLDTLSVIKDIIKMYQHTQKNAPTNEKYIKSLVDQLYNLENESGSLSWVQLMDFISKQMPGAKQLIKKYFQAKFMGKQFNSIIPIVNTPSYFVTDELFFQLLLSSQSVLTDCNQLTLLYSSVAHQGGFNQMVQSLKECKLPTIMFFQHEENYEKKTKQQIFGALTNLRWYDTKQYFGTKKDCIFSLYPYFKIYRSKRRGEQNYCFLDSNKGLGFGGKNGEGFRIWIDKNLQNSYCTQNDESYENGPLVLSYVKKLQINVIEIWAIQHPADENDENFDLKIDLKDPLLQKSDKVQFANSNADFYWVQQQKTEQRNSGFYWENNNVS
ncbi:unnamed protein product (macronuclear) [Paramecium tetraurelia]|uniref:Oxidation resistance protein 1 n=1 Tax=Paramecium tetraurelia TaxID=5888 RepID=A0DGM4_PARTE|nr:uncharacterized protein GSPATT00002320001 [Paramecium tetraurelia]CAK82191.1 unnamed protein product [Paramecium tetraurelia]|eukprot:XP_001449588.1 hypothetical protein (macronuclear) [Paramecium tetraurelia strain d4-2]